MCSSNRAISPNRSIARPNKPPVPPGAIVISADTAEYEVTASKPVQGLAGEADIVIPEDVSAIRANGDQLTGMFGFQLLLMQFIQPSDEVSKQRPGRCLAPV